MPRIPEYTPQVAPIGAAGIARPNYGAYDELAAGAARLGEGIAKVGQAIHRRQEDRDESDLRTKATLLRSKKTIELQERARTTDPTDTEAVDKFAETFDAELQQELDSMGEGLRTPRGRELYTQVRAQLTADMAERAYVEQAQLGGKRDRLNVENIVDAGGNVLRNDPTQFDSVLADVTAAIESAGYLSGEARMELKKNAEHELSINEVRGFIAVAPEAALGRLKSGDWNKRITSESKDVLIGEAERGIRAKEADIERAAAAREKALDKAREATKQNFVERLLPDVENPLTAKEVVNSNLTAADQEHYLKALELRSKEVSEPIRTVPSEFSKALDDIRAGRINNVTDIEKYYTVNRTVSWEDVKELRREWEDMLTPDGRRLSDTQAKFLTGVKHLIDKSNPLLGKIDHSGAEQFMRFQQYVAGKVAEARNTKEKDPYELFNPASPEYLGNALGQFQTPITQSIQRMRQNMRPGPQEPAAGTAPKAPPPRQPGESAADYLKRIEKK